MTYLTLAKGFLKEMCFQFFLELVQTVSLSCTLVAGSRGQDHIYRKGSVTEFVVCFLLL